jgi:hypothetical protein
MSKKQFKAESKRLLDLMINSIYTHREIFLREIISNASDAIDKLAYLSLTDDRVGISRDEFGIFIAADEKARTITVSDNGIGMTREELEQNLGVIAKSGSSAFRKIWTAPRRKTPRSISLGSSASASIPRSWSRIKSPLFQGHTAPTRRGPGNPRTRTATRSRRGTRLPSARTSLCI